MPEVHIPFGLGIDEAQRSELIDPSQALLQQENCWQERKGGLTKLLGSSVISPTILNGASIVAAYAGFAHGDTHAVIDGHVIYSYSETAGRYIERSRVPTGSVTRAAMPFASISPNYADVAYCNGYFVLLTVGPTTLGGNSDAVATIVDATTMQPVRTDTIASSVGDQAGAKLSVFTSANVVVAVYHRTGNILTGKTIDLSSASTVNTGWGAGVDLCTTLNVPGATNIACRWDIATSGTVLGLIFTNTSGGPSYLTLNSFTSALGTVGGPQSYGLSSDFSSVVGIAAKDTSIGSFWAGWSEGTGSAIVHVGAFSSTVTVALTNAQIITTSSGPTSVAIGVLNGTTTGRLIINDGNVGMRTRLFTTSGGSVTTSGSTSTYFNYNIRSRPFAATGRFVAQCTVAGVGAGIDATSCGNFIADIGADVGTLQPMATIAQGISALAGVLVREQCGHVAAVSTTEFAVFNPILRVDSEDANGLNTYANELAILDFGSATRWTSVPFAGCTYLAGGVTSYFDGDRLREVNFLHPPRKPTVATSGTGFTITNGVRVVAIWESIDSAGNVEWSAPSNPTDAFTGSNKTYDITLFTHALTNKYTSSAIQNKTQIAVYATADNGGIGPYYRQGTIANDYTARSVVYSISGSIAVTTAQLYVNPGTPGTALVRQAPPASAGISVHGDRITIISDDGDTGWFSGPHVTGEGLWFNAFQQLPVASTNVNTATWDQDARWIIAKESCLYVIEGNGPPENGGNGTEFSIPRLLPSDVGCIEPRSICTTVAGTFFRSRRGIELLDRALQVTWIGQRIQDTLETYPIVTSANLDAERGLVFFTLSASETSQQVSGGGCIAAFDITGGGWQIRDVTGSSGYQAAWFSTVSGKPRFHWVTPAAAIRRERLPSDSSAFLATSTWRAMTVETAAFKVGGLSTDVDVEKVQILFRKHTDADLLVYYAVDDSSSFTLARTYTGAELNALTAPQIEIPLGNDRRCRNVRFKVVDATPTGLGVSVGTGKGYTLLGLTMVYDGQLPGGRKLASNAR